MEPVTGVEPAHSCLQGKPTTTRGPPAWCPVQDSNPIRKIRSLATVLRTGRGAETGNRTPVSSLREKRVTTTFGIGAHCRSRTRNPACDKQAGGYRPPEVSELDGTRGRDRTCEWKYVTLLPYHLATRAWRNREELNLMPYDTNYFPGSLRPSLITIPMVAVEGIEPSSVPYERT